MRTALITAMLAAASAGSLRAQAAQRHSPYAGQEMRSIKALSDDELQGLREGSGVGLATAAELNHYPGPRHTLDLADSLHLSADQRIRLRAVYDSMHAPVVKLGESLIGAEARMDSLFAARRIDTSALAALTRESARIKGELRFTHLRAHLATRAILTSEQVSAYDRLRGYAGGAMDHAQHKHE